MNVFKGKQEHSKVFPHQLLLRCSAALTDFKEQAQLLRYVSVGADPRDSLRETHSGVGLHQDVLTSEETWRRTWLVFHDYTNCCCNSVRGFLLPWPKYCLPIIRIPNTRHVVSINISTHFSGNNFTNILIQLSRQIKLFSGSHSLRKILFATYKINLKSSSEHKCSYSERRLRVLKPGPAPTHLPSSL